MNQDIKRRFSHFSSFVSSVGNFLIEKHKTKDLSISEKSIFNLVTEADLGSEKMVIDEIEKIFPNDGFLSEEFGSKSGSSGYEWVIDPVDGTTNYAHGLPLYGVSLALIQTSDRAPVMGIVLFPELHALYTAIKGEGAFRNQESITVSKTSKMKDALFVTGFPYDRTQSMDSLMGYYRSILNKSRGIRRTGASTLDLCWVADGKLDGYYEIGLKPWDIAAAGLILIEAGGRITSMDGNEFNLEMPSVLATNGKLHDHLLDEFSCIT